MATLVISGIGAWRSRFQKIRSRPSRNPAFALFVLLVFASSSCLAQATRSTESQIKAAYLYNFGKFVTWPPSDSAASPDIFAICVLGKDPFGPILDATVAGESIDQKKIAIRRILSVQDATGCKILFISTSEEGRLPTVLAEAGKIHVLTVSDIPRFAERGGTIGLVNQQDRIRFEVNRNVAERCHLILSSELLKLAVRVIQAKAAGREE